MSQGTERRRAVFLDRDGVINRRGRFGVVREWEEFEFLPGVLESLTRLAATDYAIVVCTNQPWVGLGYIRRRSLDEIHVRMVRAIEDAGGRIDIVEAAVLAPWFTDRRRKPRPGMLEDAAERLLLGPQGSWMVGDNRKDMVAGKRFGCGTILVDPRPRTTAQGAEELADYVAADLPEAIAYILKHQ
ncbi:MAG TPA: HAD-IIIA family hydrolase [Candidatus Thermoplasmatota archaeon]|nr:HAD-IIIA family hydrolase [Candidatus Thermoplasmatota archaeon]